jgi:hypothetical protein
MDKSRLATINLVYSISQGHVSKQIYLTQYGLMAERPLAEVPAEDRSTTATFGNQLADRRTVAAKLQQLAGRPASAQNDSTICVAMRFAVAISLVPVLRDIRRMPLMAGVVNRIHRLFLPGGAGWNFRVVYRTGTSNFRLFTEANANTTIILATKLVRILAARKYTLVPH